ncbi:hypothetical protein [Streptomyces coffeae]|uniref:DUF4352 domain-containing protein n=1 Tax=Streptomyces coffeae TaxID=621382 RepID=A0ABS1NB83_9ACTN|nr:hypothetical protein [Streptomyces coffeae]MBL1097313.1 hypothetical protein [Streptomyces coffeae]
MSSQDALEHTDSGQDTATARGRDAEGPSKKTSGCAVAMVVLGCLALLGMVGLSELEKGLDGYGQLEGGQEDLGPGATAEYEDGLRVTVSEPVREPGSRVYAFTITYENGTDSALRPIGTGSDAYVSDIAGSDTPLIVRAGVPYDYDGPDDGTDVEWLNDDEANRRLRPSLGEDESVRVPVRVRARAKATPVTVEVQPPGDDFRDTAQWALTLD